MADLAPAKQSERERLFVSFWDACLENIPEGSFVHRCVAPDEDSERPCSRAARL
jgi:hypothetical protein